MTSFMRSLLDIVGRIPLVEEAFQRKQALLRVEAQQYPLMVHVILLTALAADEGLRDHWKSECFAFIGHFAKDILKQGSLSRNDYWRVLYDGPLEPEDNGLKVIAAQLDDFRNRKYKDIPRINRSTAEIFSVMKKFYTELCDRLANNVAFGDLIENLK